MGIRADFWHGTRCGLAGHFLELPHREFESWLIEAIEDYPDEFDAKLLGLLQDFLVRGRTVLRPSSAEHAHLVDRFMDTCYGLWADSASGILESASKSSLYLSRYESISRRPSETAAPQRVLTLWRYLFTGRPIYRDAVQFPYQSADDVFRLGFWSAKETSMLLPWIRDLTDVDDAAQASTVAAINAARARDGGLILFVA